MDLQAWNASFLVHHTVVAVEKGVIVGLGDMERFGYLNRLFVHEEYQHRGIASVHCALLEEAAGHTVITHTPITDRPFFEHRGYEVVRRGADLRGGGVSALFYYETLLKLSSILLICRCPSISTAS